MKTSTSEHQCDISFLLNSTLEGLSFVVHKLMKENEETNNGLVSIIQLEKEIKVNEEILHAKREEVSTLKKTMSNNTKLNENYSETLEKYLKILYENEQCVNKEISDIQDRDNDLLLREYIYEQIINNEFDIRKERVLVTSHSAINIKGKEIEEMKKSMSNTGIIKKENSSIKGIPINLDRIRGAYTDRDFHRDNERIMNGIIKESQEDKKEEIIKTDIKEKNDNKEEKDKEIVVDNSLRENKEEIKNDDNKPKEEEKVDSPIVNEITFNSNKREDTVIDKIDNNELDEPKPIIEIPLSIQPQTKIPLKQSNTSKSLIPIKTTTNTIDSTKSLYTPKHITSRNLKTIKRSNTSRLSSLNKKRNKNVFSITLTSTVELNTKKENEQSHERSSRTMDNISDEIQKKNSHDEILYKTNIFDNIEQTLQENVKNNTQILKQEELQKIIFKNTKPELILSSKQNKNSNYGKILRIAPSRNKRKVSSHKENTFTNRPKYNIKPILTVNEVKKTIKKTVNTMNVNKEREAPIKSKSDSNFNKGDKQKKETITDNSNYSFSIDKGSNVSISKSRTLSKKAHTIDYQDIDIRQNSKEKLKKSEKKIRLMQLLRKVIDVFNNRKKELYVKYSKKVMWFFIGNNSNKLREYIKRKKPKKKTFTSYEQISQFKNFILKYSNKTIMINPIKEMINFTFKEYNNSKIRKKHIPIYQRKCNNRCYAKLKEKEMNKEIVLEKEKKRAKTTSKEKTKAREEYNKQRKKEIEQMRKKIEERKRKRRESEERKRKEEEEEIKRKKEILDELKLKREEEQKEKEKLQIEIENKKSIELLEKEKNKLIKIERKTELEKEEQEKKEKEEKENKLREEILISQRKKEEKLKKEIEEKQRRDKEEYERQKKIKEEEEAKKLIEDLKIKNQEEENKIKEEKRKKEEIERKQKEEKEIQKLKEELEERRVQQEKERKRIIEELEAKKLKEEIERKKKEEEERKRKEEENQRQLKEKEELNNQPTTLQQNLSTIEKDENESTKPIQKKYTTNERLAILREKKLKELERKKTASNVPQSLHNSNSNITNNSTIAQKNEPSSNDKVKVIKIDNNINNDSNENEDDDLENYQKSLSMLKEMADESKNMEENMKSIVDKMKNIASSSINSDNLN